MSGGAHEARLAARRRGRFGAAAGSSDDADGGPASGPREGDGERRHEPPPVPLGKPLVRRDPTPVPSDGDPWIGRVISGRYRVVGKLGSGGMGEVYEAEHLTLGKNVALKIIRPELAADEDLAARFAREALASARVEHPRMAMAIDYGPLPEGGAYLVLQRARGRSLLSVLRENGPLSWQQAAEVGAQVADALSAAHGAGIVHRDLKPENLLLDLQPDGDMVVWVLDLGIARVEHTPTNPVRPGFTPEPLTRVGEVMGTPGYMSPEQAMGEPASPEADLYALGVVLWEMVAGRRLFPGDNLPDILTVQLTEAVPILSLLRPEGEVPPGYDDVVQWLLSRRPDTRPHKATLVRDALRSLLGPRDIEWPVPIFGKGWAPRGELHGRRPSAPPSRAPGTVPPAPPPHPSPLPGPELARGGPRGPSLPHPSADAPGGHRPSERSSHDDGATAWSRSGRPSDAGTDPVPGPAGSSLPADALRPPRAVSPSAVPQGQGPWSSAPPSSVPSWIPPSVLPEPARSQLPAVLLASGIVLPLLLVVTVAVLVRVFVPAIAPAALTAAPVAAETGQAAGEDPPPAAGTAPVTATPAGTSVAPPAGTAAAPGDATPEAAARVDAPEDGAATDADTPPGPAPAGEPAALDPVAREEIALHVDDLLESSSRGARRAAARFLLDDGRAAHVPEAIRAIAALEVARGCKGHQRALADIADLGDARALPAVRRLDRTPRSGCGVLEMEDCIGCLRVPIRRTLRALGR